MADNELLNGITPQLRTRTQMRKTELQQPQGWQGLDPMGLRTTDPVRTFETPSVYFPADINVPSGFAGRIPLPPRCNQIAFISVVPNVFASFNGGGGRTIKDGFAMSGEFQSLDVSVDAAGSCIIQLSCY
jgi:hypothetical protein